MATSARIRAGIDPAAAAGGGLAYCLPSSDLQDMLSIHFGFGPTPVAATETLPALLPNLHVLLAGEVHYRFATGETMMAPPVMLIGPTTGAVELRMSAGTVIVGLGMLASGWRRLTGMPAALLADSGIDAALVWPAAAVRQLHGRLAEVSRGRPQAAVMEAFLRTRCAQATGSDLVRAAVVDHWIERSARLGIDELAAALDLGSRQVERVALELHGASPKALAMKYRSLRSATRLAMQGPAAMDEAMAAFADQAHLIRDFRRFVGWTPGIYCRDHAMLARITIEGRLRSGVTRPISIWS